MEHLYPNGSLESASIWVCGGCKVVNVVGYRYVVIIKLCSTRILARHIQQDHNEQEFVLCGGYSVPYGFAVIIRL